MTVELILGDCIEVLQESDFMVDMIMADPPYNISQENNRIDRSKFYSPVVRRESPIRYDFGGWDNMGRQDFVDFTYSWMDVCAKHLRDGGAFLSFFAKEDISMLAWHGEELGLRTRTIFTWCKTNPVPSFRKQNYLSAT